MFYRRKLPHWHPDLTEATFLFVTWRLAGTIPRTRLSRSPTGAARSAGRAFLACNREVDKAAFGPVWLQDARVARVVADALLHGDNGRHFYPLRAWVIMPQRLALHHPDHIAARRSQRLRTPISLTRRATVYASSPYKPKSRKFESF